MMTDVFIQQRHVYIFKKMTCFAIQMYVWTYFTVKIYESNQASKTNIKKHKLFHCVLAQSKLANVTGLFVKICKGIYACRAFYNCSTG